MTIMKVKASTLVETIVAMVIIIIAFGTAMLMYLHVTDGERLLARTKADILLQRLAEESKLQQNFEERIYEEGGIKVKKKVAPYPDYSGAYLMNLQATDPKGEVLSEYREVILKESASDVVTKNESR